MHKPLAQRSADALHIGIHHIGQGALVERVAPVAGEAMFFVEIGDVSAFVAAEPDRIARVAQRWQAMVAT